MSHGGLRIVWDPAIDHGAWPGPLATRGAVAGEAWLGPMGLLARLETELGLGALHVTALERAGDLAAQLAGRDGWWRQSFDADPLGTCQRLLRDRDLLAMWCWRGEPASARLAELWAATAGARPGIPDRIARVVGALVPGRSLDIESIELWTRVATLAPQWRAVFAGLTRAGVQLGDAATATATSPGDLGNARRDGFAPVGDGTLTLFRPHGPLAAADEVAASLAAMPSLAGVLIIGADDVLDAALARHGLPRTGSSARPTASSALIRLVIEAAFEPMDPAELHALLALSPGPVPRRLASRLIGALSNLPGRRTTAFAEALAEGIELLDEDRRGATRARLEMLLMPVARRDASIRVAEIDRRLAALGTWAAGRMATAPSLVSVAALAGEVRALLSRYGAAELTLVQLRRLCDEIDGAPGIGGDAHAGLAAVREPGAVLAAARTIVWWNFTRETAPSMPRVRLSNAERDELRRLGVTPPDPGMLMEGEAMRWRRPLDLAADNLVFVCPRTSEAGDECSPHPLWDELCAAMPRPEQASALVATTTLQLPAPASRRTATLRPLPVGSTIVRAGVPLPLRVRESATSLDKLLGCSLSWALEYHGKLRHGLAGGPQAPSPLLFGNLAHHVLASVFAGGVLDAEVALAKAHEIVERDLDDLAENLALPRYQVERTTVRQAILATARELGALMIASGAQVRGTEITQDGDHGGVALTGKADLVLSTPDAVIDLKWSTSSHRDKLHDGAALQLAMYAELFGTPGAPAPQVGFFSLKTQELVTPIGSTLPGARIAGTVAPNATWTAALVTLGVRRAELATGTLCAPAADGSELESKLVAGRLIIAPSCQYCSFGALCGQGGCT